MDADHVQLALLIVTSGLAAATSIWIHDAVKPLAAKGLLCAMALVAAAAVPESWGLLLKRIVDRVGFRAHASLDATPEPAWNFVTRNGVAIVGEENDMIAFLNARMSAADKVFWVAAPDICQSASDDCLNLALYLAQGKLPVGHEWIFDTPVTYSADSQRAMIRALDQERVQFVGVARSMRPKPPPAGPPPETLLQDYIPRRYALLRSFDCPPRAVIYDVYERRPD